MRKSVAFGFVHLATSFGVGYALSGSLSVAGAITLVEPLVNTVAHYFFDRWWDGREEALPHAPAGSPPQGVGA